jgi:hypothetical protein
MRVYLAGPMRNYPEFNQEAFKAGAAKLREAGHEVFSPYEDNLRNGLDSAGMAGKQAEAEKIRPLRECIAADLSWISLHAEAVIVLPGWKESRGATAETAAAIALDLPIFELEDFLS